MAFDAELQEQLIRTVCERVIEHAEELVALDQAIGDGDHGINMKRGCEAVLADLDKLKAMPFGEAMKAAGMALVMKVGGASGPLYGSLLMSFGKALPPESAPESLVAAFATAVDAVKARGKADVGQKTMLDVLVPVVEALRGEAQDLPRRIRATATSSAQATVPMQATRGRASFLGERSIGHMDPGARSSELMVLAVMDVLEAQKK
jgi:dihydroxyacetone kinase-like protein